ncbi:MAG: diacylglycerol/polyprenol kinase family protein [Candidatus Hodarchaeota archaeon]
MSIQTNMGQDYQTSGKSSLTKREILRKIIHLIPLSIPLAVAIGFPEEIMRLVLINLPVVFAPVEFYRLKVPMSRLNKMLRDQEHNKIAAYYLSLSIAAILAIFVMDFRILLTCLIATNLGDATAALVGKTLGRHHLPLTKTKKIEGTIAGFLCAFFSTIFFFLDKNLFMILLCGIIVGMTVIITDFIESPKLIFSDNILNPLLAAIGLILCNFWFI